MDSERLENIFEYSFGKHLEKNYNIKLDQFDFKVEKDFTSNSIRVLVTVYGTAGDTTRREFHDKDTKKTIKGGEEIVLIDNSDDKEMGRMVFDECYDLNSNDYVVVYKEG